MHVAPEPIPIGRSFEDQLPWDVYAEVVRQFRTTLPDPDPYEPDNRDEAFARRDRAAVARVAGLVPANPAEGAVAADHVICSEIAKVSLRAFQDSALPDETRHRAFRWAESMFRQSRGQVATLLRMQAERRRREAVPKGAIHADYTERLVTDYMAAALGYPEIHPEPEPPPEPEPEPTPPPPAEPVLTEAERYAVTHPRRARLIRQNGGMPDLAFPHSFGPPPASVIRGLLSETSPLILDLDNA